MSCENKFLNVKTIFYKAHANWLAYPLFKAYTPLTINEYNPFPHLKGPQKLLAFFSITGSGSMQIIFFFGFYVQVANMRKLYDSNLSEFNENFYSVHTILITLKGCILVRRSRKCNTTDTVFPRIVSALDQYPPSNSVRTVCFCR